MRFLLVVLLLLSPSLFAQSTDPGLAAPAYGTFAFSQDVCLAGRPGDVFDAITGDISGWWHHFLVERFKPYFEGRHPSPPSKTSH